MPAARRVTEKARPVRRAFFCLRDLPRRRYFDNFRKTVAACCATR